MLGINLDGVIHSLMPKGVEHQTGSEGFNRMVESDSFVDAERR